MGAGATGKAVKQPAVQDQRLKIRVCDKIVFCKCLQTDYANLIMAIGHIAISWQLGQLARSFAREGIVVFP